MEAIGRPLKISITGIFLILLGSFLILNRVHVIHFGWSKLFWAFLAAYGFALVIMAFTQKRRGLAFWGSFLFFIGLAVTLRVWDVYPFNFVDWLPNVFLAIGLSFLVLFFYEPRSVGLLIPFVLFAGFGVVYYLWWWDVVDMFDVRHYVRTYWPVLLVLFGAGLVFKKRG